MRKEKLCSYCERPLKPRGGTEPLSETWDHTKPKAAGGIRRVRCCRQCNQLKGDLPMKVWLEFIRRHPRWWYFENHKQVRATALKAPSD